MLRSVSMLVSAGGAGQLVLLAAMPVSTRLYEPGDFGVAAVFGAILSALLMVSSLRYEMAIVLPRTEEHAQVLVRLCLGLTTLVSIATLVAVVLWRGPVATILGVPRLGPVLWLLPLAVAGAGTYRIFNFWAVRREAFGLIARTRILQPLSNAAVQIILGVFHMGPLGLVAGQFAGTAVGGTSLAKGARLRVSPMRVELHRWRAVARRYVRFPKFDVPAALVDTISLQLPNLLLALLFGPNVAGFYMLADRAVVVPLALLGQALGQVIYSKGRESVADGSMLAIVTKTVKALGGGVILLALFFMPLAPLLFAVTFGEAWRGAGLYSSILFLGFGAQFVFSSISLALPASGGQHLSLVVNLTLLVLKSAALYFGYARGSALDAIIAYSAVTLAGNALAIAAVIAHLERRSPKQTASRAAGDA